MKKEVVNSLLQKFYQQLESKREETRAIAIIIFPNGSYDTECLDEKPYNHAVAFNYMALKAGLTTIETMNPLVAGNHIADQDVIALQIRDRICICYFPESILSEQYITLDQILLTSRNLKYQFKEYFQQEGYTTKKEVLDYAKLIILQKTK